MSANGERQKEHLPSCLVSLLFFQVEATICQKKKNISHLLFPSSLLCDFHDFFCVQISVESYLDMACSVAVLGGGSNKEYALHILHRCNGSVKVTIMFILIQN